MSGVLQHRIALVTGGRGGVGRAVCERFEREGAVVYAADLSDSGSAGTNPAGGDASASDAASSDPAGCDTAGSSAGGSAASGRFLRMDVTSEQEVAEAVAAVGERHGRIDVLVNAAGIEIEKSVYETTLEEWNRVFAVNVTGTFLACKHALAWLRASESASIVNFGSYDGFIADPGLAAYCASKGAVHALTKAMACDHGPEGIRVNAVCPGYLDTPMLRSFFGDHGDIASLDKAVRDIHPLRTFGTPADAANLVNWLASDESRYASGQLWILDGGLSAQVQQMRL